MKITYYILLLFSIALVSCSDDADDEPQQQEDTTLTGKVRGIDFAYGSGRFVDFGVDTEEFVIRIDNAGPMVMDSCTTNSEDAYIRLDVLKETGRKELSEDNNISVVFHHPDIFQNLIIYGEGWYDIKSFDTDELEIEFDINSNDDNNIKGSCIVYRCN